MKDEIRSVLQMAKDGKITDEQAVELIAALGGGTQGAAQDVSRAKAEAQERAAGGWASVVADVVRDVLHGDNVRSWRSDAGGAFFSSMRDNDVSMSKVDAPATRGESVFADNRFTMSHLSNLRLRDGTFGKNTVDASKMTDITLDKGKVLDCSVMASACEDWNLDDGALLSTRINGSHVRELKLTGQTQVDASQVTASHVRDLTLNASMWAGTVVRGAHVKDVRLNSTGWEGVVLEHTKVQEVTMERSTWHDVMLQAIKIKGLVVNASEFKDVLITAGDSWRRQGFKAVRFEGCKLDKVLFSECFFSDVVIKDVTLTDVKIQNVTLKDQTIVGNEAFLKAMGPRL